MVEQLIVTAEREIIRKLPGEPYDNYLESIELKEQNDRLVREVADLRAMLGSPLSPVVHLPENLSTEPQRIVKTSPPVQELSLPETYVVQPGDSLYAISKKIYGDSSHIDSIYSANRDTLKSKNSLQVGQTLRLPQFAKIAVLAIGRSWPTLTTIPHTTKPLAEVLVAMQNASAKNWANPSSPHRSGLPYGYPDRTGQRRNRPNFKC